MNTYSGILLAIVWLLGGVAFDLISNSALMKSKGFHERRWAFAAIVSVSLAYACMARSLQVIPLSIVYALWSVLGIIGTLIIGRCFFSQRISKQQYVAITFMTVGIGLMSFS